MQVLEIPLDQLEPASWNSNAMDESMLERLERSLATFGMLQPLVVRRITEICFEIIGGSHRFMVLKESGAETAPCVVVEVSDSDARRRRRYLLVLGVGQL